MNSQNGKCVAVFSNTFWSIYNFRKSLVQALLKQGCRVIAISAKDQYRERLEEIGCETVVIKNLDVESVSVLKELRLVSEIRKALQKYPIEYIFTYTIKPNLYTALANSSKNLKQIVTVNGLGNSFSGGTMVRNTILQLFRIAFRRANKIIFQNKEDCAFFQRHMKMDERKVVFVRGSGVNVNELVPSQRSPTAGTGMIFLLACRLLKKKGVYEYIETARRIKETHPGVQFWLLGMPAKNPSSIDLKDLQPVHKQGVIHLIPPTDNINALLEKIDVLVLPSYYNEGIPRILLEGLSKGLPLITTNSVGCKETVFENLNGYLIEPKSIVALEEAIRKMMALSFEERTRMGRESRKLAEREFDERKVIETYLGVLQQDQLQVQFTEVYSK